MTSTQILKELKDKKYHPVYFLSGEEPFFIDQISNYMDKNILNEAAKDFDQTVVYGKDTDVANLIAMAKRFPMLASHQLLIVREAQELKKIEELESYVLNPQPTTILVLEFKHKKADKRKAFYKALKKNAVVFESKKLYDNQVPKWVEDYVFDNGYKINPKNAQLIAESLGNNLQKVSNELQKVFINMERGGAINEDIIESHIGISKDFNIFELQDALINKNVLKANQIINYFAANPKENPYVVTLTVLFNFFSKVLMVHQIRDQRSLASTLGVNPYFVKDYQLAAKNYKPLKLVKIIGHLRNYDVRYKGVDNVSTTTGELLKELMFKILH